MRVLSNSNPRAGGRPPPPPSHNENAAAKVQTSSTLKRPIDTMIKSSPSIRLEGGKSAKRRSFGDEVDTNNVSNIKAYAPEAVAGHPQDSSILSMESRDTALSSITEDDNSLDNSHVAALRGWLDDFGKQNKKHYEKAASATKTPQSATQAPRRVKLVTTPTPPPSAPSRLNDASIKKKCQDRRTARTTPIRIVHRNENDQVQATNEGYASVAKLSQWLAADPTKKQKVKQLRRGANVIAMSRAFDKGLADVIIEESHIKTGSVREKKESLIRQAFSEDDQDDTSVVASDVPSRTYRDTDADSVVSVTEKKDWLNTVFKKAEVKTPYASKAKSEIITDKDSHHDVSAKAKQMWRQRTPPRRTPVRNIRTPNTFSNIKSADLIRAAANTPQSADKRQVVAFPDSKATNYASKYRLSDASAPGSGKPRKTSLTSLTPVKQTTKHTSDVVVAEPIPVSKNENSKEEMVMVSKHDVVTEKPMQQVDVVTHVEDSLVIIDNQTSSEGKLPLDLLSASEKDTEEKKEIESPVNAFQAARNKLLQRARMNGNALDVVSKVNMRKSKFEQLEREMQRKSNPNGLLKSTWEEAEADANSKGAYNKVYVEDAPKKKNLKELP